MVRHDPHRPPRIALVLGGGGIKGFAHIGALRAIDELGIVPTLYAGTSIGALLAAARVGGMSVDEMERRAVGLRKRDLFRLNHFGMLLDRMRSPSIYLEEPLRALCRSAVPSKKFNQLPTPLLVNTVDLIDGTQVVWGLPGLDDVSVQDAVYSSCALPGFFPPGRVGGRTCVDGGVVDNLPVQAAALNADIIVAVDVGSSDLGRKDPTGEGFATIYMRAATTMMHALQLHPLQRWSGPPMILIRPRLTTPWLSFDGVADNIAAGYEAAKRALADFDDVAAREGGIYPRRSVHLEVIREKCVSCGMCAALAPRLMGLDTKGKAFARMRHVDWSPADGDFVHHCPTNAIVAHSEEPEVVRPPEPMPVEAAAAS